MYAHIYTHMFTYTQIYKYTRTNMDTDTHMRIRHLRIHTDKRFYIYARTFTYICAHKLAYVPTHTYTHIHMYARTQNYVSIHISPTDYHVTWRQRSHAITNSSFSYMRAYIYIFIHTYSHVHTHFYACIPTTG